MVGARTAESGTAPWPHGQRSRAPTAVSGLTVGVPTGDYGVAMDILRRLTSTTATACEHVPAQRAAPSGASCEECGRTGSLRLCATCGHVGCCESHAGHARAHAHQEGHPVIYQMPADSGFVWCYAHRSYVG
jgi:hypothetical protein